MPLIDLKTDLKSLKYGKDRPGGGDSGQPYIKTDINTIDQGFNRLRLTKFDDGLIRGGAVGALNASVVDTLRIGKFFKDFPHGPLFLTKQIGLQLSNPRLETKTISINNGTGILGFVSNLANTISSNFGPTRIYNLGINTLAQVPVNAFGKHFNRHGLTPVQDDNTKYFAVVSDNNKSNQDVSKPSNRLVGLKNKLIGKPVTPQSRTFGLLNTLTSSIGSIFGFSNPLKALTANQLTISDYLGGPGSTYGVGKTLIRRYDITENGQKINSAFEKSKEKARLAKINWNPVLNGIYSNSNPNSPTNFAKSLDNKTEIENSKVENQNAIKGLSLSPTLKSYKAIQDAVKFVQDKKQIPPVYDKLSKLNDGKFKYYGKSTISSDKSRITYENPINGLSRVDSDILTNVFTIIDPFSTNEDKIFLSSYMKGFKEDFNATWGEINYAGRAESFYVYNKFKRNTSFNLQIPCFNRKELFEKHRALGQLASTTAGSYNSNGFLNGVLIKLNIGNYIVGEYSILNSLNYNIPDDASWDVTPEGRLAMLIDASFNFTIIHKELPQYKKDQGFFKHLPLQSGNYSYKDSKSVYVVNRTGDQATYANNSWAVNSLTSREAEIFNASDPNEVPLIESVIPPNQLRGFIDSPINNPNLPSSQTPFA